MVWVIHAFLVVFTVMALFIAFSSWGAVAPVSPSICVDAETREHARRVMLEGVDDALKRQFRQVYQGWMKDPHEQPQRAVRGMQQGMAAYIRSRRAAQEWSPPEC